MIRMIPAFLARDLHTELSYRSASLLSLGSIFFNVLIFYFLAVFVGDSVDPLLQRYDGDYFAFILIGVAFSGYFNVGLSGFAQALRQAQITGTLEAMLMTPASLPTVVVGSAAWSYVFTTLRVLVYLLLGTLLLGVSLGGANYAAALVGLILSIIAFGSIGIIAASVIMVTKRGEVVTTLTASVANLVGGIFYPIEILPEWLQVFSRLIPLTYALRVMRDALLANADWQQLAPDLLALTAFCVVLFPLSLGAFRFAVEQARREGTLAHY